MAVEHDIAAAFALGGEIMALAPHGRGLINATFLVTVATPMPRRVVLQRLNRHVFPQPERVMANLRTLLDHANRHGTADLRLPQIVPSRSGEDFITDADGNVWRAITYIENTRSVDAITTMTEAEALGDTLGRFHCLVHDLECARLHDTLPGFHVTPDYLHRYDAVPAPSRSDEATRFCLDFIEQRREAAAVLEDARAAGRLRSRPIHGDPKVDNVLFDIDSDRAVSLIDLDTVKPGLLHYDIGDCLRSACNRRGEAADTPSATRFDLDLARTVLGAYLRQTRDILDADDIDYLYAAIRLLPFELGLRFFTDHLEGDRYFRIASPGQNLHRALIQFHLAADIERQRGAIESLIAALAGKPGGR